MCAYSSDTVIFLLSLGRPTKLTELMGKAEMWLIRTYWDLEFPRPLLPSVDFVGGLHCRPAKPLPKVNLFQLCFCSVYLSTVEKCFCILHSHWISVCVLWAVGHSILTTNTPVSYPHSCIIAFCYQAVRINWWLLSTQSVKSGPLLVNTEESIRCFIKEFW